jgi:hypothetical protein
VRRTCAVAALTAVTLAAARQLRHHRPVIARRQHVLVPAALLSLGVSALLLSRAGHEARAVELPPVARDMTAAFAVPPLADAELPDAVAREHEYLPNPGKALPNETRRIAHGLGKNAVGVYVFPTTEGKVCSVITESTSMGGCVDAFRLLKGEVAWSVYSGETAPHTVTGLVSNRVAAISVRLPDRFEPAAVARNTFFWQAPTSDTTRGDIKGLVVRWHNGRTFYINLDFGRHTDNATVETPSPATGTVARIIDEGRRPKKERTRLAGSCNGPSPCARFSNRGP